MNSYASFRKCDFQVHTPRDPNWRGLRPRGVGDLLPSGQPTSANDVEAERRSWASSLIDACIAKGLGAIAITDHHEMVLVASVLEEVRQRAASGQAADLWVFPGMELTLQDGVQCIIIFDAALPPEFWLQAQGHLGIAHAANNQLAASAAALTQLPFPYDDISNRLDPHKDLVGRYIVLPNVSQGGQHTVVRDGWHQRFRGMSYVGGYVDAGQNIATCSAKHQRRLSGKDATWGNRFIYPLPTSDAREHGFPQLGTNNAWIKLSAPTAESLRQAFLAWQSRICIEAPQAPSVTVKALRIRGANPLADADLSLSPEFNCVIGGRGSGKSTLLEYLAFGLGRSCADLDGKDYTGTDRLTGLIQDTLMAVNAEVHVEVIQDGAEFAISRTATTGYQPQIRYPNGRTEALTTRELRSLIPAYAYSQGELSELGSAKPDGNVMADLLQFVEAPYKSEAEDLEKSILASKETLAQQLRRVIQLWQLQAERTKIENRIAATRARIEALQASLPTLDPGDQASLDAYAKAVEANQEVARAAEDVASIQADLESLDMAVTAAKSISPSLAEPAYEAVRTSLDTLLKEVGKLAKQTAGAFGRGAPQFNAAVAAWQSHVVGLKIVHDAVIEKIGVHKATARQIADLQTAVAGDTTKLQQLDRQLASLGDPAAELRTARQQLRQAAEAQTKRLAEWCRSIEQLSDSTIGVLLAEQGDLSEIHAALDLVAAKTRSQEAVRRRKFAEATQGSDAWAVLNRMLNEISALLRWKILDESDKQKTPKFETIAGILGEGDAIAQNFAAQVDQDRLISLAKAVPGARVTFRYKAEGREIAFEKASEGQRAAVLLMMLLKQEGGPLIVDQPEGDLDNSVITRVVDLLHAIKHQRQLIFATHNANLVVNGAAEFVAVMTNSDDGRRIVEQSGAIDHAKVRLAITTTMEGGEQAFRDRQRKYGF